MRMLGRRMTALLASMVLLAGVLPVQAAGLQMPAAKKAQMEVPSDWLSVNVYSSLKDVKAEDVKVTVTYDGYLGSLKASDLGLKGDGEVPVLKEGSHIQFQIQHKNPMTYYNFCYLSKNSMQKFVGGTDQNGRLILKCPSVVTFHPDFQ